MSAAVVPFPIARRRDFIVRQAQYALSLKPQKGEEHIARQVQCQAQAMRRRGVAEDLVGRELNSMAAAIRAVMWQVVMQTPGGAA